MYSGLSYPQHYYDQGQYSRKSINQYQDPIPLMSYGSSVPQSLFPNHEVNPARKMQLFPRKGPQGPQSLLTVDPSQIPSIAKPLEHAEGYGRFTHVLETKTKLRKPLLSQEELGNRPVPQLSAYKRGGVTKGNAVPLLEIDPTMPLPARAKVRQSVANKKSILQKPVSLLEYEVARLDGSGDAKAGMFHGNYEYVAQQHGLRFGGRGPLIAQPDIVFSGPAGRRMNDRPDLMPSRREDIPTRPLFDVFPMSYEAELSIGKTGGYGSYCYGTYNDVGRGKRGPGRLVASLGGQKGKRRGRGVENKKEDNGAEKEVEKELGSNSGGKTEEIREKPDNKLEKAEDVSEKEENSAEKEENGTKSGKKDGESRKQMKARIKREKQEAQEGSTP